MARALITGATGQDGTLLSRHLIECGDTAIGLLNSKRSINEHPNHPYIREWKTVDFTNSIEISTLIQECSIDVIYNLAGFSSVSASYRDPIDCFEINTTFVLTLVKSLVHIPVEFRPKLFQASSSEMYGVSELRIVDESSPMNPISPYALSKFTSHKFLSNMREALGLRTSSAILFNHESHLRPTHFVSKRIISGLVDVFENKREFIEIHNPNVERDWGSANEYVKAMRLIAMSNHNDDFIVASGECNSIKRFIEIALNKLSISRSFEEVVRVKKESDRPLDHRGVAGDSSKIQKVLGWTTNSNFETLVEELVQSELSLRSKHAW